MRLKAKTALELCALAAAILLSLPTLNVASEPNDLPITGQPPAPELKHLDQEVKDLLVKWNLPGASIAIVKNGKLVFCRGYGYADVENRQPIDPERSLFRIASISKTLTAAAVFKLIQDKKLTLKDKAFDVLKDVEPAFGAHEDRRLNNVCVQDLLDMSAGWDKEKSGDPVLQPYIHRAARRLHRPFPADFDTTLRYVIGHRLDFPPGTRFAYSNFEYGVLGKIIERVSGEDYQSFVRSQFFQPCGVQLYQGHTRFEDRLPNEVVYYAPLEPTARCILCAGEKHVPAPYGRAYMESDLPMFGWVASAPDLAILLDKLATDDTLLEPETRALMLSRPPVPCWQNKRKYFGMGWEVTDQGDGKVTLFKDGTLPGTRSFVEHTADGVTWVALFNGRPPQKIPDKFAKQVKAVMTQSVDSLASRKQSSWVPQVKPAHDYRKEILHDWVKLRRWLASDY